VNVVYIMTDRHNPEFSGCYGNSITRTPHIDALARRGTRFNSAYCPSPLCAPSRGAMMAGRFAHEISTWDNAFPYAGVPKGWGHYFADHGVKLTTIGKLDYLPGSDMGVEDIRLAKIRESLDIHSLFEEGRVQPRYQHLHRLRKAGPASGNGEHEHDALVTEEAVRWLMNDRPEDRPWILIVNIKQPHPGWNPSQDLWDYYDPLVRFEDLDERYTEPVSRLHPFHQDFVRYTCSDLCTPEELRRGLVGYHGICEMADRNVGRVLQAINTEGLWDTTLVAYASDHGGSMGAHHNSGMGSMYEDSIRVPMIVAGPGIGSGEVEPTPVSHFDLFQTFSEALALPVPTHMRGTSLLNFLRGGGRVDLPMFAISEFHGPGLPGSAFALRMGSDKYVECVGERPMLFDLATDPLEMHDLAENPEASQKLAKLRRILYQVCCPEAIDRRAKADQQALRERLADSGRLVKEMWKRGYERNPERMIPRPEFVVQK
jgi:choline-sulfatase